MVKNCKHCGKIFWTKQSENATFCSKQCLSLFKNFRASEQLECAVCGTKFTVKGHRLGTARFCSPECRIKGLDKKVAITCAVCGKQFSVKRNRAQTAKYCSRKCSDSMNHLRKDGKFHERELRCDTCGKLFTRRYENAMSNFCGRSCFIENKGITFSRRKRETGFRTILEKKVEKFLIAFGVEYEFEKPFGRYSVDFVIPSIMLAIECDGFWHRTDKARLRDARKDVFLKSAGWRVVRFNDVEIQSGSFMTALYDYINSGLLRT